MRVRGSKKRHFWPKKVDKKEAKSREGKREEKYRKKGGKREAKVTQNSPKTMSKKEMEKEWRFGNFDALILGRPADWGGHRGGFRRGIKTDGGS